MRPTAAETLESADRLLRAILAEAGLSADTAASITSVLFMLKQVRVGWSTRLPFLADDNQRMLVLLAELAPDLPAPLSAEVMARCVLTSAEPLLALEAADELNASLRELLSQVLRVLPAAELGHRERIRGYLLERLELEPA